MGLPVSVTTGETFFTHVDAVVGEITISRTYSSARTAAGRFGMFGPGWNSSLDMRLVVHAYDVIEARLPDGVPLYYFDGDHNGVYELELPKGTNSWIEPVPGGGFTRMFRSGGYESYNGDGRIQSIVDSAGITTTYSPGTGAITTITRRGRVVTIEYLVGRPSAIRNSTNDVLANYSYAQNRLEDVGYPGDSGTTADDRGYRYVYDSASRILWVKDHVGTPLEAHTYDSNGRTITSEIADGQETLTFEYAPATGPTDNTTTVTDALGNETVYHWAYIAHMRRVKKIVGPCQGCGSGANQVRQWTYYPEDYPYGEPPEGRIKEYTDGAGKTWTYTYDPQTGDLLTVVDPGSEQPPNPTLRTTTYMYYAVGEANGRPGLVKSVAGPGGSLRQYTYGPAGPLTITEKVTASESRTTTMTYYANGKVETVLEPGYEDPPAQPSPTTYQYHPGTDDLWSMTDPAGHVTTFAEYDNHGRLKKVKNHLDHETLYDYDKHGRITTITLPDGTSSQFAYDSAGRRTKFTDALGNATLHVYDRYGRLESTYDAENRRTAYGYDAMSNLTSVTNARGYSYGFTYEANQVTSLLYGIYTGDTFTYDDAGRLKTRTNRKGVTTTYGYDDLSRLASKTYTDGSPAVTFTYHPGGQLATAGNGADTIIFGYDYAGQLTTEQSAANASTVTYTHWPDGRRRTVSLDTTPIATYTYWPDGLLKRIDRGGGKVFDFTHDEAHRRDTLSYPNGVLTDYGFNTVAGLMSLVATRSGSPISSFVYGYDDAGYRTSKTTSDFADTYEYDNTYRLLQVERTGQPNRWFYDYDAVGNRGRHQAGNSIGDGYYDGYDRLIQVQAAGAMRWRGALNEPGNVVITPAQSWNARSARMLENNAFEADVYLADVHLNGGQQTVAVQATDASANVRTVNYQVTATSPYANFQHDNNGNQIQKLEGGVTWTYAWDVEDRLKWVCNTTPCTEAAAVASFKYDALGRRIQKVVGGVTQKFTYDGEDTIRHYRGGTSVWLWTHGPGVDEPLARVDEVGNWRYFHADGLGSITRVTTAAGAVATSQDYDAFGQLVSGSLPRYGFTGREWDAEIGLYYYRARYYDPKIGRFISEDPIGFRGGVNFYAYVGNSPLNFTDPEGLMSAAAAAALTTGWTIALCEPTPIGEVAMAVVTMAALTSQKGDGCNSCRQKPDRGDRDRCLKELIKCDLQCANPPVNSNLWQQRQPTRWLHTYNTCMTTCMRLAKCPWAPLTP